MSRYSYERLGLFYLGGTNEDPRTPVLFPSKHLVTHAVIAGMTGSGKTGLGVVLLEECAIDGIPAIIIDPKGDLGNLMLAFPGLDPEDIAPWASPGDNPVELAERHAKGLADWGQDVDRVELFANSAQRVLYTPGSTAGRSLRLMPPLTAPATNDAEILRERALATTSALLALVGVDADPVTSPEHTLIAQLLLQTWSEGGGYDLNSLLRAIQEPPFAHLGAMDVESVLPQKDRVKLAIRINNAFASPAMSGFMSGEPLDIQSLLYTDEGRAKLSILSIAHLSDSDRMFFVTIVLSELLTWMRAQPGTTALRAVLYMDEVFGFFPPVANPPSKLPMLTLLKQARAFGLGVVLATQNPADLDYKGLSNTGTWIMGRLQTERDKLRVLDGLESASSGAQFDRGQLDALLSDLPKRTFILRSVHEPETRVFSSRYALSFLRGPLTRDEMRRLARASEKADEAGSSLPVPATSTEVAAGPPGPAVGPASAALGVASGTSSITPSAAQIGRPVLPPDIRQTLMVRRDLATPTEYRPGFFGYVQLHYVHAKSKIDHWTSLVFIGPFHDDDVHWEQSWRLSGVETADAPLPPARFAALPRSATQIKSYKGWQRELIDYLYQHQTLRLMSAPALELFSGPGESEIDFRRRIHQAARERRDEEIEALRAKWQTKIARAHEKIEKSKRRLEDSKSTGSSGLELGAEMLGVVFGGQRRSLSTAAQRVVRTARKASKENRTHQRARSDYDGARDDLEDLELELEEALEAIRAKWQDIEIAPLDISPRKADIRVDDSGLMWVPV